MSPDRLPTGASRTLARVPPAALQRATLVAAALVALLVTIVVGLSAASWVGRSFPGFFVLPNRVVPSIARDGWSASRDGAIFQRTVVAVAGRPVAGNGEAYRLAAAHAPGALVEYTLRRGATVERLMLPNRVFSRSDYWMVFGSYLATGLLYLWLGVLAAWLRPDGALGRALLVVGGLGGIYALTGAGIYEPAGQLRIHALAEAFFPAALITLALTFTRGAPRVRAALTTVAWWVAGALAIPYQLLLAQPSAYSAVHAACEGYLGLAGLVLGATLLVEWARAAETAGVLLRAALAGTLLGLGVPAIVMTLSSLSGGVMPVNLVTATAFCFPLCIVYGLLRERALSGRALVPSFG